MEIILTKQFKKRAQKLAENRKNFKKKLLHCLNDFAEQGRTSPYFRHQLKGDRKHISELQIGGDIRLFVHVFWKDDQAYFLDIGTHSQLDL